MISGVQLREMKLINEPGLYTLILRTLNKEAKQFKR
jgi:prophage antirepressor-like protein